MSNMARWLDGLGLKKYAQTFADNEIDFDALADLNDDDLKGLGIPLGPRKKLHKAIASLEHAPSSRQAIAETVPDYTATDSAGRAERRHLTVMFCDLVDSTSLAERLDPEEFRDVIRSYQNACNEAIERYEGYIARYVGDGLFVHFGFPHAHEDEAERAVHSALGILKAVHELETGREQPLRVRIGISTGLVVVGDIIGHGASEEQAVVGETPNIAARLHTLAEPDSILISASTRRLLGDQFNYEDLGTQTLKGISAPMRIWRIKGARALESRFDATHGGRLTALIGRDPELELMFERWRRAAAGEGQVILLAGEAGIGKSRIIGALRDRIATEDHVRIYYQCSPHHIHSPLYPAIKHLEFSAGIAPDHHPEEKAERLASLLTKLSVPDTDAPLFKALLSLRVDPPLKMLPEEQKQKTLRAISRMFETLANQQPLLWVVEDAHWSDPTTQQLIALISELASELRCLIVVTYRHEFNAPWSGLGHCTMLTLNRLGRDASSALIAELTGGRALPKEVSAQILAKTDGVPMFVEELTSAVLESEMVTERDDRYLLTGSLAPLAIPSTLQDSLMARLDRLEGMKVISQVASVIGREFTCELLEAVSPFNGRSLEEALNRLNESGIVLKHGTPPHSGYLFKHALVQDAAYESLLRSERQLLHARIARLLEERYPDRAEVEPDILAHHYTRAGLAEQAVIYWELAGQRALDRSANLEVIGYADRGLQLINEIADRATRQRQELNFQVLRGAAYRAVKGFASSKAEESFARARELCEELGDETRLIDVLRGLYSCHYARGELSRAGELGKELLNVGHRMNDSSAGMLGHWMLGCINFWQGKFPEARHHLEQASSLYDPSEQRVKMLALQIDPGVNALFHLGWTLWILGYPEQAVSTSDQAIRTARGLSQPFALSMALFFACETRACAGHEAGTGALLAELRSVSATYGLEYLGTCARVLEGQALIARNESTAGLQRIQQAFTEFQEQEAGLGLPWAMSIAATAYRRLGNREEGLATVVTALHIVKSNGERHWEAELQRLKGELSLMEPGASLSESEHCFRKAMELARRQGAKSLELRAAMSLARLYLDQGNKAKAGRELSSVYAWFTEGGSSADLRDAASLLKKCGTE